MPITTPPLPPATPAQQRMLDQFQSQKQNQSGEYNNNYAPNITDESTSNSVSESENVVSQSGSLINLQNNNNYDTFFRYGSGTHIPTTSLNLSASILPNGNEVISANLNIPLGGRSKKLAHREVELASISKEASICTGIIKAGIDYSEVENLSFCNSYKTVAKVVNPATALKQQMEEQLKAIKRQQQTIQALQLRLTQLQHLPTPVKATY